MDKANPGSRTEQEFTDHVENKATSDSKQCCI